MIKLHNLNKYDSAGPEKQYVLHDLSLTVDDSESVVIQGTPDEGKSVLLRILSCMDQFDSGSYLLDGIEIGGLNSRKSAKLSRSKIGFMFLHSSLADHKTVLLNAMRPLLFSRVSLRKRKQLALEALQQVGLEQLAQEKASQLSEGQKRRLAIARTIITAPRVILADEPTKGLDAGTSAEVMALLKAFNEKGITLIIVSGDDMAIDYCRRKVILQDGRIVQDLTFLSEMIPRT